MIPPRASVCRRAAVLWPLAALSLWLGDVGVARGDAQADNELEEAQRAYARGAYKRVIRRLTPLLYPTIRLSAEDKVLTAYKLLGIAQVFEKNRAEATKQFNAMLSMRPDYQLDSVVDPLAAVELFEEVKQRNAEKLRRIQKRIDEERRRQEQRRRDAARRERDGARQTVVERTRDRRSFWVNFVPFGIGQLQNGHRRKGYLLLGLQAACGAVSLSSAIYYRAAFSGTITAGSDEERSARRAATTQVVSGALFFAAIAYGIIDALAYFEPETVKERTYKQRIALWPTAGPDGVGLGMRLRF